MPRRKPRQYLKPLTDDQRRAQEILSFDDLPLFGIHFSRAHIYKLIASKKFPPVVHIGVQRVGFDRDAIMAHIAKIKAGRAA
jgi:predicted DNA-binding transcriptional regulator AlpA